MRIIAVHLIIIVSLLLGCAQKEKPVSKAHPASYITETFGIDNGMPMREVQKQEFYFKKCELESRRPFQSRVEFSCHEN